MIKKSKVRFFKSDKKDFKSSLKKHLFKRKKNYTFIKRRVSKILSDIKKIGDMSLIKMVNKYDGNKVEKLNDLKIHYKQLKEAFDDLPMSHKEALRLQVTHHFQLLYFLSKLQSQKILVHLMMRIFHQTFGYI